MTILDRTQGGRQVRIDMAQLGDEVARRVHDLDRLDLGRARGAAGIAVHDAAERARHAIESAGDQARARRAGRSSRALDSAAAAPDDLARRLRAAAGQGIARVMIAGLIRALVEQRRNRADVAAPAVPAPARTRARPRLVVVGLVLLITTGIAAALILDPKRGKARRDAIARRLNDLTGGRSGKRAPAIAVEPEASETQEAAAPYPETTPIAEAMPVAAPAWPADEGPIEQPLHDRAFGAHEALPEELVSAEGATDPGEPTFRG